jgi:hypothetical protein
MAPDLTHAAAATGNAAPTTVSGRTMMNMYGIQFGVTEYPHGCATNRYGMLPRLVRPVAGDLPATNGGAFP